MSELDAFIPVINGHIDYFGIKKKNELIRMIRGSVLNDEELVKIKESIKGSNE